MNAGKGRFLGLDIASRSVKAVLLDSEHHVLSCRVAEAKASPRETALRLVEGACGR